MAIEQALFINNLNANNPPGSDPVGQADDHIRLLKSVLKTTFPNITGQVSSTQAQLNFGVVPTGAIIMWSGASTAIPTGWGLCDGSTYAKTDGSGNVTVPDLRDRFIVGASSTKAVSSTGGAASNTPTITMSNASTVLTQANMPLYNLTVNETAHNHTITDPGHSHTITTGTRNGDGSGADYWITGTGYARSANSAKTNISLASAKTNLTVSSAGSGTGHTHANTATSSVVPTLPPFFALCFIYKL